MTSAWLISISNILWVSLILLLASAYSGKTRLASSGWALFGVYWMSQPGHYIAIEDYFNAALTVAAALFCFYLAWIIQAKGCRSQACAWASYAAAVCGIIYFPFAEIDSLQTWLIGFTTQITAETLNAFSVPVSMEGWNMLVLNGRTVEIILACTAIESIALFAGVIVSVQAPLGRRLAALLASTLTIYVLNIVRNSFVLMAYGWDWFGSNSFHVAHNIIAKAGSTVALLAIAYLVFALLPELLEVIDELAAEIKHPGGDAA
jgi:archaeosortase A (PGF-CTERM-specific)